MSYHHRGKGDRNPNPAHFMKNEEVGFDCDKCGSPMIAVEWDGKWFAGCSAYHDTGCRNSKPIPKTKPLVDSHGAAIKRDQQIELAKLEALEKLVDEIETELQRRIQAMRRTIRLPFQTGM